MITRENPARPSEIVGSVAVATTAEVDAVVANAHRAHQAWAQLGVGQRAEMFTAALGALDAVLDDLAVLLARESGKPLQDCRGELGFALTYARWVTSRAVPVLLDTHVDDALGRMVTRHEPFGVIAAITPWNAPIILSMLKVAPAVLAGNAIVVKPSPLAPLAVSQLLALLADGLPSGLLQVVHGGAETGAALIGHRSVRKVAFTGGEQTGRAIAHLASEGLTPAVLELGGNDPAIFLDDAALTDEAMDRLVMASFATSGQVCMAAKRLYVHTSRYDDFVDAYLAAAARVLVTGDPLEAGVTVGPLVTRDAADRVTGLLSEGTLHRLGESREFGDGYFVQPALVTGLADEAALVCQEQFGPAVPLLSFSDEAEVIARANAGELGLGASVWSADEDRAFALGRRLEAGFVFINTHNRTGMSMRAPFGGVKSSGYGREYGDEGLREYTQTCVTHAPAAFRAGGAGSGAAAYPAG